VKPYPGLPVEVAIVTGRRTMLAFLLHHFADSFEQAFNKEKFPKTTPITYSACGSGADIAEFVRQVGLVPTADHAKRVT